LSETNSLPHHLDVLTLQTAEVAKKYIKWGYEEIKDMTETLIELQERVLLINNDHEKWLSNKS
jgi:hypothetical protein